MKHLRTVATGVATLALGAALAAWGGAAQAQDKSKQVYFLSWGGTIQTMLEKEGWADQFAKDTGYTVTLVPKATSGEIIATAVAQKEKPQVDVVTLPAVEEPGFAQERPRLAVPGRGRWAS